MKIYSRTLLVSALMLIGACGQKGPLIVQQPTQVSVVENKADEKAENTEREVSQDEPVLNIQTDETSAIR